ncbi:MAG: hypothetical protein AAFR87_20055 [Bacteroidota bacterium]
MKTSKWIGILLLICLSCNESPIPKIEKPNYLKAQELNGTAWQMDYSMEIHEDTSFRHVPKNWLRIKTFTQHRFTFTGYDFEQKEIAGMGGGTYSLRDSVYEEQIEFHHRSDFNGTNFTGQLYFDSLYLYQRGKVGELILEERWHRID